MRVLYLHQYFATPDSSAGTRSYEMARRLVAKGHEVTLVTTSAFFPKSYQFVDGWSVISIDGITIHVLKQAYSNKTPFLKRMYKFVEFLLRSTSRVLKINADIIFATSTPLTIAIPAIIYKKVKQKPLVFEVRDLWPELPIAVGALKSKLLIKLAEKLEKWAYVNSDAIVALSPGMRDGVLKVNSDRAKVTVITNSCDNELFFGNGLGTTASAFDFSFLKGRRLVVYTGTFGIINDVSYLVRLAKASLDMQCKICFLAVGDGMEKAKVVELASQHGVLNKNLFFHDPIPKKELVEILGKADLSLSLFAPIESMWHNSANKLFDSLASRTPVAINYGGWQAELIRDSQCGLVLSSHDYKDSIRQIDEFLSGPKYQVAISSCDFLAKGEFSRDFLAQKLEGVLGEVLDK